MATDKNERKAFYLNMPFTLFEDFYKAFPKHGERKRFLLDCIEVALAMASEKDIFVEKVIEEVRKTWKSD